MQTAVNGQYLYLTANGMANGGNTDAHKVPGAEGNVFWAPKSNGDDVIWQTWIATHQPVNNPQHGLDTAAVINSDTMAAIMTTRPDTSFICRYYSATAPSKRLTTEEAAIISGSGVSLVSVYQDANNQNDHFGTSWGSSDAEAAYNYAKNVIGQPQGSAIYFAVDYNPTQSEIDTYIVPYFQTIAEKFSNEYGGYYKIGVYGSGMVCNTIKQSLGLAQLSWLAQALSWYGTGGYNSASLYDIKQGMEYPEINNIVFDDNSTGEQLVFGQWIL